MSPRGCSASRSRVVQFGGQREQGYVLLVHVESARALEELLQQIRSAANVQTRSTIIQTFYTDRRP